MSEPSPRPPVSSASSPRGTPPPNLTYARHHPADLKAYLSGYFWTIFKNVLGWILILASWPVGVLLPGPGGIPLFLIGFALVTFPGKRKLTSRLMRGRPFNTSAGVFVYATTFAALLVTVGVVWVVSTKASHWFDFDTRVEQVIVTIGLGLLALFVTWLSVKIGLNAMNFFVRTVPRARRMVRPWLRRQGIDLLPARRKFNADGVSVPNEEILGFDERHVRRLQTFWSVMKAWGKRLFTIGVTALIFYFMLKPLWREWDVVKLRVGDINWVRFGLATLMFAAFLFFFRSLGWRAILRGLGYRVPVAPATRIWATSELARYIPGVIWQVVGRITLLKPYGVRGSVTSTSQVIELVIFLLGNVIVAVGCLLWFGGKQLEPPARYWFWGALALLPVLTTLIHPKVVDAISRRALKLFGKPPLQQRLKSRLAFGLLGWNVLGLLWMCFAVWLIVGTPLQLPIQKWWVVAGAYCLAWIAGFLAVWAPGGLGVRELVFMAAMRVALPPSVQQSFPTEAAEAGFLTFLAILLRLWTVIGEIIVTSLAYAFDLRGARGDPDAPGRVAPGVKVDPDDEPDAAPRSDAGVEVASGTAR